MKRCLRNTNFDFLNVKIKIGLMKDQIWMSLNHSYESKEQKIYVKESRHLLFYEHLLIVLVCQLNREVLECMNSIFYLCILSTLCNVWQLAYRLRKVSFRNRLLSSNSSFAICKHMTLDKQLHFFELYISKIKIIMVHYWRKTSTCSTNGHFLTINISKEMQNSNSTLKKSVINCN